MRIVANYSKIYEFLHFALFLEKKQHLMLNSSNEYLQLLTIYYVTEAVS